MEDCNDIEALNILSKRPEIRALLIDTQDCLGEDDGEYDVPVRHEYRDESGQKTERSTGCLISCRETTLL